MRMIEAESGVSWWHHERSQTVFRRPLGARESATSSIPRYSGTKKQTSRATSSNPMKKASGTEGIVEDLDDWDHPIRRLKIN
jgi:hypothetical protein